MCAILIGKVFIKINILEIAKQMKNIVIVPNMSKEMAGEVTSLLVGKLANFGFNLYSARKYSEYFDNYINAYDEFPKDIDLIIVIGGDGSVLDASVDAIAECVPIVGVNLGKIGYLSEVEPDNLDVFARLLTGDYSVEEKMLLALSVKRCGEVHSIGRFAVNDVVVSHENHFGISDFKIENSRGDGVSYRADGMIFSTPSGSTAYSLSAGGPIVAHNVECILATPVCPHSFFNRSILFNASDRITLTNTGKSDLNVSVDGRFISRLSTGDECIVSVSKKTLKMLTFSKDNMFSTLFRKMRILEDVK